MARQQSAPGRLLRSIREETGDDYRRAGSMKAHAIARQATADARRHTMRVAQLRRELDATEDPAEAERLLGELVTARREEDRRTGVAMCEGCGERLTPVERILCPVCGPCVRARHKAAVAGRCVCGRKARPRGKHCRRCRGVV